VIGAKGARTCGFQKLDKGLFFFAICANGNFIDIVILSPLVTTRNQWMCAIDLRYSIDQRQQK
jgi:hypothetical protein